MDSEEETDPLWLRQKTVNVREKQENYLIEKKIKQSTISPTSPHIRHIHPIVSVLIHVDLYFISPLPPPPKKKLKNWRQVSL